MQMLIERTLSDVRYAARTLRQSPGFTITAAATLALGIGLNTALFTLIYSTLFRPLPVRDARGLVTVHQDFQGELRREVAGSPFFASYPEYSAYRDGNRAFAGLAAYAEVELSMQAGEVRALGGQLVTCNYFPVLQARVVLGRTFASDDCAAPGRNPVAVVSNTVWRERLGGSPAAIGAPLSLNGQIFTVIGVAEPEFIGTEMRPADVWIPVTMQPQLLPPRSWVAMPDISWLQIVGRLRPGMPVAAAQSDLAAIARHADEDYPGRRTIVTVDHASLISGPDVGQVRPGIAGIEVLSALTMLMACLNVMNLMLARMAARQHIVAVSFALGASRRRVLGRLLAESVLLALLGGALGLLLAAWIPPAVVRALPVAGLRMNVSLDGAVFAYAFLMSLATVAVFGLWPVLRATSSTMASELRGAQTVGRRHSGKGQRARGAIVAVQVGGSFLSLVVSVVFARGLAQAQHSEPGFATRDVIAVSVNLVQAGYDSAKAARFMRAFTDQVSALPGAQGVALARSLPLVARTTAEVSASGTTGPEEGTLDANINTVSGNYFATMGIPLLRGDSFTEDDLRGAEVLPVIVSAATARRLWHTEDVLGRRLHSGRSEWFVKGVARDVSNVAPGVPDATFIYLPASPDDPRQLQILVRASPGVHLESRVKVLAQDLDPSLLVTVVTFSDALDRLLAPARVLTALIISMGMLAAALALIGVYGVVSYSVGLRNSEFGVRLAFGAAPGDITRLVLRQSSTTVIGGLLVGIALAIPATLLLDRFFATLRPGDPLGYAGTRPVGDVIVYLAPLVALGCAALLAALLPAYRASRLDPAAILRAV